MVKKVDTDWYRFEQAIAAFLSALDPTAKVTHNVEIPDKHTGSPRQRDVWIESKVAGFNVTIYVSCKHLSRKINQQDMDAFIGELASSCADKGVMYSKFGFNDDALNKAKVCGIDCCVLVDTNDFSKLIPQEMLIRAYARRGQVAFMNPDPRVASMAGRNAFLKSTSLGDHKRMVVVLGNSLKGLVQRQTTNDEDYAEEALVLRSSSLNSPITLTLAHRWVYYEGQLTGYLVEGSYNFKDNAFQGSTSLPIIDTQNPELGPDWKKLPERPAATANQTLLTLKPDYIEFWKNLSRSAPPKS